MLQSEFKERTGIDVALDEYRAIEVVYINSDLDKDEFCKMWCKMNASRIRKAKEEAKAKKEERKHRESLLAIFYKLDREIHKRGSDICNLPSTWEFLSNKELSLLEKSNIEIGLTWEKAIKLGYSGPRFYKIDDTRYHIKKFLKIA